MSKIQAIPFIQAVLVTFTPEQQATLVSLINGSNKQPAFRSLINPNHMITTSDKGVNHVTLETKDRVFTGYLLYNNSYCVLLAYAKDTQNLVMVDIDLEAQDYRTVEESLTILELRFSLEDAKEPTDIVGTVQSAINSGAIDVKAIENIENTGVNDGTVVKIIGFDSEGNLVEGVVSEGQVVDQSLDRTSTNAVGNAPVATAIEGLQSDISDINTALDTKADISALENGTLVVNKALTAEEIAPVSEESGTIQDDPFISQGTGTENNTGSTDTSPVGKQLEKQGNTLCVNQLVVNPTFSSSSDWYVNANGTLSISDGIATLTSATTGSAFIYQTPALRNRKYLAIVSVKPSTQLSVSCYWQNGTFISSTQVTANSWTRLFGIGEVSNADGYIHQFRLSASMTQGDTLQVKDFFLIDLTQMFNGDIPQDLLDNPSHFSWYYNGSLANNAGTLKNADGRYLVCTGRNLWDEETRNGYYTTSGFVSSPNYIASKNPILVTPNRDIFIKAPNNFDVYGGADDTGTDLILLLNANKNTNFAVPSNIRYLYFSSANTDYGTTYNHDITISLYYSAEQGGEGYDQYYPYQEPKVYDTGTEELLAFDTKDHDGTVHENTATKTIVGSTDVGEVSTAYTNVKYFYINKPTDFIGRGNYDSAVGKIKCSNLVPVAPISLDSESAIGGIVAGASQTQLWFGFPVGTTLEQAQSALDGETFQYELADASKTTSQGTPFPENIEIDDYGMMYWLDTDGNLVDVPQGVKLFYPAWYVGFLDSLYARTSGDATDVVVQSELADSALAERGYQKVVDLSDGITDVAGLTYNLKKAYKTGNIVTLSIHAYNAGSSISADATLFTLSSNIRPYNATTFPITAYVSGAQSNQIITIDSSGNVSLNHVLGANEYVYINITYAVA